MFVDGRSEKKRDLCQSDSVCCILRRRLSALEFEICVIPGKLN